MGLILLFAMLLHWPSAGYSAAPSAFAQVLERLLPDDGTPFGRGPDGETLYGKRFIQRMYEKNRGQPIWRPEAIRSFAQALTGLAEDGLNPDDYRFPRIRPYLQQPDLQPASSAERARVDVLLTEAYLRALYNLYYGKTDPQRLDPNNNFAQSRDGKDRSDLLLTWPRHARIDAAFNWARPYNNRYSWLRAALVRYQAIRDQGGWASIPAGPVLRSGDQDPRIRLVRRRLAATGDLPSAQGPNLFDDELLEGLLNFQERHYLNMSGEIDATTLEAMNVPVQQRIDQIRVNMERQRWLFPTETAEFIVVDIAGYTAFWLDNEELVWQEQIQVGRALTQTPVFKDRIQTIEFNPDWRDSPEESGLMGQVRFLLPNPHQIFLHEVNHWELLSDPERTTTNTGSIRVANALDLAERLLARQGWTAERIDAIIESGKRVRVDLQQPIPILIHYSTAWATEGQVSFKPDIYARDPGLLAALNGPFVFHQPDLKRLSRADLD